MQLGEQTVQLGVTLDCCDKLHVFVCRVEYVADTTDDGSPCVRARAVWDEGRARAHAIIHTRQHESES